VRVLGQEAQWLDHGLSIQSGGMFRLTHQMSFDALPDCVESLKQHWQAEGYTPAA
jgi:hypothetical protein